MTRAVISVDGFSQQVRNWEITVYNAARCRDPQTEELYVNTREGKEEKMNRSTGCKTQQEYRPSQTDWTVPSSLTSVPRCPHLENSNDDGTPTS